MKNSPERYGETAGVYGLELASVRDSVSYLLSGAVDYEFRTTVVREFHNRDSFRAIGPWLSGARRYFLQSFADRDTVLQPGLHPCSREELEGFAALVRPYVDLSLIHIFANSGRDYEEQDLKMELLTELIMNGLTGRPGQEGEGVPRFDPVSYTHLDVYKRQPEDRGSPPGSWRGPDAHYRWS